MLAIGVPNPACLIAYMRENASSFTENISDLQMFYKNAKVKFDTDDDFKRRANSGYSASGVR